MYVSLAKLHSICEQILIYCLQLLSWAFGDFEYVEDFTTRKYNGKQLPVRVYTTRGLKEQGRFGLLNAHQIIDYFSEVCLSHTLFTMLVC